MLKKGKKRLSITVDADELDRVSNFLKDKAYPFGTLSHYFDACLSDLGEYLETGQKHNIDALLEIEIDRIGLKAALEQRGARIIEWSDDDLKPRRR